MIVISYLSRLAEPSLANHRAYAERHGYRHVWVDASPMPPSAQSRAYYKLQVLLNTMDQIAPGELILLLTENAAIVDPIALDAVMEDCDWLLVRMESPTLPQTDVQIWRNKPDVRQAIVDISWKCRPFGGLTNEAEIYAGLLTQPWGQRINGVFPVLQACFDIDPLWDRAPTFAICIENTPAQTPNTPTMGVCASFCDALVKQINRRLATGVGVFSSLPDPEPDQEERSRYNPGNPIALVTLYTPNAGRFAHIAERNFRRYCERHGYTLYIHRDIPAELGIQASGNWYKPWLLQTYLAHHEWVVWLDADVLFADMDRKLEPLLGGRDVLVAHDTGEWAFNSGVMGFRSTPKNKAMIHHLTVHFAALKDKSEVWASGGDQGHFIAALEHYDMLGPGVVSDQVAFNTYWEYRRPDSFIVHYAGMWWDMRALMMAHDDGLLGP